MIENEYEYTQEEFLKQYNIIKSFLVTGKEHSENINTILVNGQPGSGKSFYESNLSDNSIIIDTDAFRRFHPRIKNIKRLDAENYAERTQAFASAITEKLINELAKENYNLVIEGTLRTIDVPINTCNRLKENGHKVNLVVIACDACEAWESTISRAHNMMLKKQKPRLVPIDKYDYNIQNIVNNLKIIKEKKCFDSISIVTRDGKELDTNNNSPEAVLETILNVSKWNQNKEKYEREYLKQKIAVIEQELNNRGL